ncbi:MAG TPA: hypothetical protein VGN00_16145 [Puia sp.]|jgi:hypothetical protein
MGLRYSILLLKKTFRNLYFLMFFNGFILASLFYFKMESSYENALFATIKSNIDSKIDANDTPDSILVKSMNVCYQLMSSRASTFVDNNTIDLGLESTLFHSTTFDLMTTQGACGSYSQVLARIIGTYHYPVRIAQMKANGIYGAHNIVEAYNGSYWIVMDPTYNVCFTRPDSRLASFADVQHNWPYYAKQVPREYNLAYHYEDVRYANWTKVPILFPAIKGLLNLTMGTDRANTLCIRTLFLNTYSTYFYVILLLYIPIFLVTFRRLIKTKIFPNQDIPVTFRNIIKYIGPRIIGTSYIH